MSHSPERFRPASQKDVDSVLRIMGAYYREDGYPFSEDHARVQLNRFLGNPQLGSLYVAVVAGQVVGYLVVTLGFSFEYGGRDAFIDELYIIESCRGTGLGREAMRCAEAFCRVMGVRAMLLEVELHRTRASTIYEAAGFAETGRRLMTKRLPSDGYPLEAPPAGVYGSTLARIHHAHFGRLAREAAHLLREMLEEGGRTSGTIVELGCGSGISSRALSDAGYDVVGIDLSEPMLRLARAEAPEARFEQASLWDCPLPRAVAITAIGEAFCYRSSRHHPDASHLEERFRAIFEALTSGGILMFDISTAGRSGPAHHRCNAWEEAGTFVYLDEREDPEGAVLTRTIDSFVPTGGLHCHDREQHELTLFDAGTIETSLRHIGFECTRRTQLRDFELLPGWVAFVAVKPR